MAHVGAMFVWTPCGTLQPFGEVSTTLSARPRLLNKDRDADSLQ